MSHKALNSPSWGLIPPCVYCVALFLGRHGQTFTHSKEGTETGQHTDTTKVNGEPTSFIGVIYRNVDEGLIQEQKLLKAASPRSLHYGGQLTKGDAQLISQPADSSIGWTVSFLGSSEPLPGTSVGFCFFHDAQLFPSSESFSQSLSLPVNSAHLRASQTTQFV